MVVYPTLTAMKKIAQSDHVYIENPVLLILGINKQESKIGLFIYTNGKLVKYE
jgi:hypothetical protein